LQSAMKNPLVSVIIPVFNGGNLLVEALESVFAQSYSNIEVIVVDDGSTDNSVNIISRYKSSLRFIRQENGGSAKARNTGILSSSGDYISFLDQDDLLFPKKIEIQLEIAARHPESAMIVCDGLMETSQKGVIENYPHLLDRGIVADLEKSPIGEITYDSLYRRFLRHQLIYSPNQIFIPKYIINNVGLFNEFRGAVDYEYYLRVAAWYPITFHSHSLVHKRYNPLGTLGPYERRSVVVSYMIAFVLKHHRLSCPIQYRKDTRGGLHYSVKACAWHCVTMAPKDIAYARLYLYKLFLLAPMNFYVIIGFILTLLPKHLLIQLTNYLKQWEWLSRR
jgi:glycosyltransferase involved in cell wall biosynthesis